MRGQNGANTLQYCLRISQRSMRDVDLGPQGDIPKAGYLCARSVSFLLRLSPKSCTKEHKALLQSVCPRLAAALKPPLLCHTNTWNLIICAASAYLQMLLLVGIRVHKHTQASEVVHISKHRACKGIKIQRNYKNNSLKGVTYGGRYILWRSPFCIRSLVYQMAKPSPFRFFFPCPWILKCTCISQSFRLQGWKQTVKTMPLRYSQHRHSLHLQIGSTQWSPLSKDKFKGSIQCFSVTLGIHSSTRLEHLLNIHHRCQRYTLAGFLQAFGSQIWVKKNNP